MVEMITQVNNAVNGVVWGPFGLALLFCTGGNFVKLAQNKLKICGRMTGQTCTKIREMIWPCK